MKSPCFLCYFWLRANTIRKTLKGASSIFVIRDYENLYGFSSKTKRKVLFSEMEPQVKTRLEKFAVVDVLHFERNSNKKCRHPKNRENLSEILRRTLSEPLPESDDQCLETLPKNFCKKDLRTGIQKQFECLACKCLIESLGGLLAHLKGDKHAKTLVDYVPTA